MFELAVIYLSIIHSLLTICVMNILVVSIPYNQSPSNMLMFSPHQIKNIPFDTEEAELKRMFAKHGRITRFILPPYRTIALVMYDQPSEARKAFMQLAYKKFKHLPLYLEWAPEKAIGERLKIKEGQTEEDRVVPLDSNDNNSESKEVEEEESGPRSLFVKNLHFMTTEAQLLEAMARICTIVYKNYTTKLRNQGKDINNLKEWRIRAASIQKRKEEKKVSVTVQSSLLSHPLSS